MKTKQCSVQDCENPADASCGAGRRCKDCWHEYLTFDDGLSLCRICGDDCFGALCVDCRSGYYAD